VADRPRQPGQQRPDGYGVGERGDEGLGDAESSGCGTGGLSVRQRRSQQTESEFVRPSDELGNAERRRSEGGDDNRTQAEVIGSGCCSRWPSRPCEPQYDWEAPRLIERGVGGTTDGMARRLRSRANKSMLRILGNGWVPQIPVLIYQWIAEVEALASNHEGEEQSNDT
jgi:hypothetical protein